MVMGLRSQLESFSKRAAVQRRDLWKAILEYEGIVFEAALGGITSSKELDSKGGFEFEHSAIARCPSSITFVVGKKITHSKTSKSYRIAEILPDELGEEVRLGLEELN